MKKALRLVTILTACFFVFSSQSFAVADESFQKDTARINDLIMQARKILYIYPDSTEEMINSILELSEQHNYEYGLFNGLNLKGNMLLMSSMNIEAIQYFRRGLVYCDTLKSPRGRAILLSNLGLSFLNLSNLDSAIYYYDKAYEFSLRHRVNDIRNKVMYDLSLMYLEKSNYLEAYKNLSPLCDTFRIHNDTLRLILAYSSLGVLYTKIGSFDSAYLYYRKANELDALYPSFDNRANYNNVGELYFRVKHDYDSALIFYRKSIYYGKGVNENYYLNSANVNIGNVFYERQMYDSAYYYYSLVHDDPLTIFYPYRQSAVLINIGEYFRMKNAYATSREYLEKGISVAESNGYVEYQAVGYLSLSRLDSCEGNWYSSLNNFKKYKIYADSIIKLTDQNEIEKLALDHYISKKKYDNQILIKENQLKEELIGNQQRLLYVSLAAFLMVVFVLVIVFLNHRKIKKLLAKLSEKHTDLEALAKKLKTTNDDLNVERVNLKEANITKDKFLSILSHDLRGPFHSLQGMLQLLDTEWEGFPDEEKKENIHLLYLSSLSTLNLLEDILSWGKSQQGKLVSQPEVFNVCEQLDSIIELYSRQATNKDLVISVDIPRDLTIESDPRFFTQIMQNLLNNAIKFSYREGKITIDYSKKGTSMDFCVRDEGMGIPDDKLTDIFKIASTFRRTGTENEKSTGMGLILCGEYASILNATLKASSILPSPQNGKPGGSVFCLRIPNSDI